MSIVDLAASTRTAAVRTADLTVVLYAGRVVKASYAFKKGKMTADDVTRIVSDLSKILPSK